MADVRFREKQDPVFDTLRGNIGLVRERLMKNKDTETEQENAIKKAIIEAIVQGKTQAPEGMDYAELGVPRGMDLGKFKPREDIGDIKSRLDVEKTLGEMSAQREFGSRAELATGLRTPNMEELYQTRPELTGSVLGVNRTGQITAQDPTAQAKKYFEGRGTMPIFSGQAWKEQILKTPKTEPTITPATAAGILADPIKAQQFKKNYPTLYPQLENIVKGSLGGKTFTGQIASDDNNAETQDLIDEYQTTDDPERLTELEDILTQRGVNLQ